MRMSSVEKQWGNVGGEGGVGEPRRDKLFDWDFSRSAWGGV
jgi:hypothetical protein